MSVKRPHLHATRMLSAQIRTEVLLALVIQGGKEMAQLVLVMNNAVKYSIKGLSFEHFSDSTAFTVKVSSARKNFTQTQKSPLQEENSNLENFWLKLKIFTIRKDLTRYSLAQTVIKTNQK